MPRTKTTRNPLGTILKQRITRYGRKATVFIARKRYTSPSGEKKVKFKRCFSQDEAQIALLNFQTEIQKEAWASEERARERTFFELTEYFRTEYCKPAVFAGNRQIAGYRQNHKIIETYLEEYKEFFGDVKLKDLTYERIRRFREHLFQTPGRNIYGAKKLPKPSTVNRKLSYLRRVLNIGIRLRWMPPGLNPFNEGEPLIKAAEESANERILTFEEEQKLLELCGREKLVINTERGGKPLKMEMDNPYRKMKLILILAIDSGLRHKELLGLRRADIRLDEKIIRLPAPRTKALKERIIPLSERLENELRRMFEKNSFLPEDFIFAGQTSLKKIFAGLCRHAGVRGVTFHALRHTATSWMDEAGLSRAVKQNIVGHSSDAVHQRYHNPSVDVLDRARVKMNLFRRNLDAKVISKVAEEKQDMRG